MNRKLYNNLSEYKVQTKYIRLFLSIYIFKHRIVYSSNKTTTYPHRYGNVVLKLFSHGWYFDYLK